MKERLRMEAIRSNMERLAAQVMANFRQEFGMLAARSLLSGKAIDALIDAHVLRVVATWETEITAEKIDALRNAAHAIFRKGTGQ